MQERNCCCGISLRTGTLAIGYFSVIKGFIFSIFGLFWASVIIRNEAIEKLETHYPDEGSFLTIVLILVGVSLLIECVLSLFLVYGAHQEKRCPLLLWIVWTATCLGLLMLSVAASFYNIAVGHKLSYIVMTIQLVKGALYTWFLVVVCNYRQFLQERGESDRELMVQHVKKSLA